MNLYFKVQGSVWKLSLQFVQQTCISFQKKKKNYTLRYISALFKENITYWHDAFFSEILKTEIIIKTFFFSNPLTIFNPTNPGGFQIFTVP